MIVKNIRAGFGRMLSLLLVLLLVGVGVSAQETDQCETGLRLFEHAMGETCIPESPQRVVVLDTGELDNALALGAVVVGAPLDDALAYQEYLGDQFDGITDIGTISTPNLEVILSLAPDLILGSKQRYEAIYDQLTQIAPTALTESLRVPWQDNFLFHADALGKTVEAEQLLAEYATRISEVQAVLGDELDTITISVIRFRPGQVRLYLKSSYIGYILQDVGLARPPSQDEDTFSAEISLEEVASVDADYIFITGYAQDDSDQDTFLQSPLWQTLDAVQNGRAIDVDDDTWIAGLGAQAALLVLDDLETLLAPSDTAAFPVTIEHMFGSTTIPAQPQRVVAIGYTEQDYLLAVGVTPVAVRYWYGDEDNAIFTWAQDFVEGESPVVLNMPFGGLNYEAILAFQPDLISAVTSGILQDEYEMLSQIAPTIAQSGDYINFGMPWQGVMLIVGDAVGKGDEARAIVTEVEALFADARASNPQFEGKTVAVAYQFGGTYGFFTAQDSRGRFFTELGFVMPDELLEISGDSFYADISAERVGLLDQDLIVIVNLQFVEGGREALEADPLFSQLAAVQEGRIIYLDLDTENAVGFSSPLSLKYALDGVLPALQVALP